MIDLSEDKNVHLHKLLDRVAVVTNVIIVAKSIFYRNPLVAAVKSDL